jgi:signal transduction histidine kinase
LQLSDPWLYKFNKICSSEFRDYKGFGHYSGFGEYLAIFIFQYCLFMSAQTQEIYVVVLIATALALLLVGFIVTMLFLYQRRQHRQEQQLVRIKDEYQQELLRSQLEIQETTFKTIAMELHDNIGQVLSVVKLSLSILPLDKEHPAYESVQSSRQMLNKVIYDMGNLTKSLHTDRIAQIGLVEAMRFDLDSLRRTGLLEVDFSVDGTEYRLEDQRSIFLYRMFQEMLNNILKHSKATRVNIAVNYSIDNKFVLQVEDNGVGFDVDKKRAQASSSSGIGLKSMTNRASLIGAQISVQSQPGKGTSIQVEVPLK